MKILKLKQIKDREQSILDYLKNNEHMYFRVHMYNGYDEGELCLNFKHNSIAVGDEVSGSFVTDDYDKFRSSFDYYFCEKVTEELLHQTLIDAIRYYVASEFALKGFSHKSVLWALHNCEDENWFTEIMPDEEKQKQLINEHLKERLERFKFVKRVQNWIKQNPEYELYKEITFSNHEGDHGYIIYDFIKMKVYGYEVNCWSSYAFGGNCNCVNHDPGEEFEYDLCEQDFNKIREIAEKEHLCLC